MKCMLKAELRLLEVDNLIHRVPPAKSFSAFIGAAFSGQEHRDV